MQENVTVTSPVDFYNAATSLSQDMTVLWLSLEDIEAATQHLDACFEDAVAGAHQFYHVVPIDDENVHVSRNSPFTGPQKVYERRVVVSPGVSTDEPAMHTGTKREKINNCKVGDFVLVKFETGRSVKVFLGQCLEVDETEANVSFLRSKDSD